MTKKTMYIPSVGQAAKKIIDYYRKGEIEELSAVGAYLENNDVARSIAGDENEFHNATVELTRIGFYDYAYALAEVGHNRYSRNTDLLGDLICYGLHCKPLEELEKWYKELIEINQRFWSWRAYRFSFDYWMERLPYAKDEAELAAWEEIIVGLFTAFKENFKYLTDKSDREKAFVMEFEYYSSRGQEKEAINALKEATTNEQTANKCAQCALKLADMYFEMGTYSEAYKYANMAVNIKEDQSSISQGYAYYLLAMSLEWKERNNRSINANIQSVYSAYYAAYIHLEANRDNLLDAVKKQVKQLEFEYKKPSGIDFSQLDEEKGDNMQKMLLNLLAEREKNS